jgi:Cys-rich repeat protein
MARPSAKRARAIAAGAKIGVLAMTVGAFSTTSEIGCKADPPAARMSRRGEVCAVSSDCADGLACLPIPGSVGGGGICVTGSFKVAPTAKECVLVECQNPSDCCDQTLAAGCNELKMLCSADAGTGSTEACLQYTSECGCQNGTIDCRAGKCISHCKIDSDCTLRAAGSRCAGGTCVQCTIDSDCGGGQTCKTGKCQAPCVSDGECSGFDRCIGGQCIPSGCQADRECIASTRNVDARCGTDGKCIVPCQTDLECGNPTNYNFFSCIDQQCTYVGCESDKDCRLFYTGPSDASVLPLREKVMCKDPGAVGAVTH